MDKNDFYDIQKEMKKNELLTQVNRFTIMLILKRYKSVQFNELQDLMNITPGNLDHHLKILENSQFLTRKTKIIFKNVGSIIEITEKGSQEIDLYLQSLKHILEKISHEFD